MKISMSANATAFLDRLIGRRSESAAEPPTDWQAASVLTVAAPTATSPGWQVAATACPIATDEQPTPRPALLYAFASERDWMRTSDDPARVLAALLARALARSATVEVYLAAESIPETDRNRIFDALTTDDPHQIPPGTATTGDSGRWRLNDEAGYTQLATGMVTASRPDLVDITIADIQRGRLSLAKCPASVRRLLGAVALSAEQSRLAAQTRPWEGVRPDETVAAVWAERASSTMIVCNSCRSTEENCADEREAEAVKHAQYWGADPYAPAAVGLSSVARATSALVSPRAIAVTADRTESTTWRIAATSSAWAWAAVAVRSAAARAVSAAALALVRSALI